MNPPQDKNNSPTESVTSGKKDLKETSIQADTEDNLKKEIEEQEFERDNGEEFGTEEYNEMKRMVENRWKEFE